MTREEAKLLLIRPTVSSNVMSETKAREIEAYNMAIEALSERTGGWIKDGQFWRCSECGTRIFSESYMDRQIYHAFCGRCGARMEK